MIESNTVDKAATEAITMTAPQPAKTTKPFSADQKLYYATAIKSIYPNAEMGYDAITSDANETAVIEDGRLVSSFEGKVITALVTYRITSGVLAGTRMLKEYCVCPSRSDCEHLIELLMEFFPSIGRFEPPDVSKLVGKKCSIGLLIYLPGGLLGYGPVVIRGIDVSKIEAVSDSKPACFGVASGDASIRTAPLTLKDTAEEASTRLTTPATNVRMGQVWTDADPKLSGGRTITVQAIDSTHAECRSSRSSGGNLKVVIRLNRFKPNKKGYVLVQDVIFKPENEGKGNI